MGAEDRDNTAGSNGRRRRGTNRVTVKDVAQMAGVAPITVSRALNRPESVSVGLREKIDHAVQTLGYLPNRLAGGLASAATRVIPVIVPSLSILTFIEVIRGVQETLEKSGYQMLLGTTDYDLDREASLVDAVLGYSPAGLILTGLRHRDGAVRRLRQWGRPVVEILELGEGAIDMNVGLSNQAVGAVIARHLAERGYRNIAFMGTRMDRDYRAEQRFHGHRDVLEDAGLRSDLLVTDNTEASYAVGARALRRIVDEQPEIDAIHFANDNLAAGAILEAGRNGIRIPDDIAIAGYLGLSIGEHVSPRLTTVTAPRYEIGCLAAAALLSRLRGEESSQKQIDIGFRLEVREST